MSRRSADEAAVTLPPSGDAATPVAVASLSELSTVLWRERELLELLLFKMEEEQLLLAAGRSRWLGRATHEVEIVLQEIRKAELTRALEVAAVAELLGLGPDPSLRELAEAAGSPWTEIFDDHRQAFLVATDTIAAMAETNRELVTASASAVRDALARLTQPQATTYSAGKKRVPATPSTPRLFDRVV
jgi:hypothetical protein